MRAVARCGVQLKFWSEDDGEMSLTDVMRLRPLDVARVEELEAALRAARAGDGAELRFEIPRGFSPATRALARVVLGAGVVVAMVGAVAAFLAPSAAGVLLLFVVAPASGAAAIAAGLGYIRDIGLRVFADGRVRRVGWGGMRENNVRDHVEVTVSGSRRPGGGPSPGGPRR